MQSPKPWSLSCFITDILAQAKEIQFGLVVKARNQEAVNTSLT